MIAALFVYFIIVSLLIFSKVLDFRIYKREKRDITESYCIDLFFILSIFVPIFNLGALFCEIGILKTNLGKLKMFKIMDIIIEEYKNYKNNNMHIFVADKLRKVKSKFVFELTEDMLKIKIGKNIPKQKAAYYIAHYLECGTNLKTDVTVKVCKDEDYDSNKNKYYIEILI